MSFVKNKKEQENIGKSNEKLWKSENSGKD